MFSKHMKRIYWKASRFGGGGGTDEYPTKQKRMQFRGEEIILLRRGSDHFIPSSYLVRGNRTLDRPEESSERHRSWSVIKMARAYCTTSADALCILTGMPHTPGSKGEGKTAREDQEQEYDIPNAGKGCE